MMGGKKILFCTFHFNRKKFHRTIFMGEKTFPNKFSSINNANNKDLESIRAAMISFNRKKSSNLKILHENTLKTFSIEKKGQVRLHLPV